MEDGERYKANRKFWLNLKIKENMIIQRSIVKWLNDGDVNSRYFHAIMKKGMRHNFIGPISTSRGMISSVKEVKEEVFGHFKAKFKENDMNRPVLEGHVFKSFSGEEKESLEPLFEEIEIKDAI